MASTSSLLSVPGVEEAMNNAARYSCNCHQRVIVGLDSAVLGEGGAGDALRPFAPPDQILKCVESDIMNILVVSPPLARSGCNDT